MELKEYLRTRNFEVQEFAKLIGITPGALSNYIHKRREPRRAIRKKIIDLTNNKVTLEDLVIK